MSGSRARNFRRRADDNDDDDEPNGSAAPSSISASNASSKPSSTSSAVANKPKKANPQVPKLLSFASDEENDAPLRPSSSKSTNSKKPSSARLAKPSSTHKITALKDRIAHSSSIPASVPSNVQPQAGTYTKEALRELQKNTRTLASSRPSSESKPSAEPVIVLKGLLKPAEQIPDSAREAKESTSEDEEGGSNAKSAGSLRRSKEDTLARMASMGIGRGKDSSGSSIPDQATINAIRAKRERMRQAGVAAPDYISLDAGSNRTAPGELSDEEAEFPGRIAMIGGKLESSKKGVFEEVDEQGNDGVRTNIIEHSDEDEEEKIWEEEQFRKGLGKRMDDGSTRVESTSVSVVQSVQQQNLIYPTTVGYNSVPSMSTATSIGGSVGVSQGLDGLSISQQAEIAKKAMQDNMGRLKESYRRTASSVLKTDENLSESLLNITALEKALSAAGEKFIFMQKLRDFVSIICDFLQHKAPFIEELEEQMQKLHEERASTVVERRVADNDDEMVEIEMAVKAATSILNKKGSSTDMIAAATSAAQAAIASSREQANLPAKLDEFGRDLNLQKRMDMKRRAEARKRRRSQYDSKRLASTEVDGHQKVEGESSTDESDSDSAAYQSNRDLLLQTAEQIFSDAAEEFSQLSVVKQRFEEWKKDYSATYRDAYMSLSIPAIFSPYVRLELLKWDPLHENADFFDMNWHSLLFNYGMPEDGGDFAPNDADANLVPELVEKVALPILHHEIAHCWDMLSTRETRNAAFATSLITNYVPTSSEALTELLVVIRTRLSSAVEDLMVPTWNALVMKAVPNAARIAAYRFGMSVRLLRNICLWKEIIALPILEKLALEELLYGKVLPHVRSIAANIHDAVTRTERIIASLSGVWTGPSIRKQSSMAPDRQPEETAEVVEDGEEIDPGVRLMYLANEGDLEGIKELLDSGIDVNFHDVDNRTALHVAACQGCSEIVDLLLRRGAEIDPKDRWGSTPLADAIFYKNHEVIKLLEKSGAKHLMAPMLVKHAREVPEYEIDPKEFDFTNSVNLTKGTFHLASWRGIQVAVKELPEDVISEEDKVNAFRDELALLQKIRHPNVVQFLGAVTQSSPMMIVTEYLPKGDLCQLLQRKGALKPIVAVKFALDIARGMNYLHENKPAPIIHRDLEPSNILRDDTGNLKVADFGVSKLLTVKEDKPLTCQDTACRYVAPEVFKNNGYDTKVDVFSFALILQEMIEGQPPFSSKKENAILKEYAAGARPPFKAPAKCYAHGIKELIEDCWDEKPSKRPTFRQIITRLETIHYSLSHRRRWKLPTLRCFQDPEARIRRDHLSSSRSLSSRSASSI